MAEIEESSRLNAVVANFPEYREKIYEETLRIEEEIQLLQASRDVWVREVAEYSTQDKPVRRFVVHAAMLQVLRDMDLEDAYLDADVDCLEGNELPRRVLHEGWMLMLPIVDNLRPIINYRPSDEGNGFKYSLTMRRISNKPSAKPQRSLLKGFRRR